MRVDVIDLYQLHRPDPNVPIEDSIGQASRDNKQTFIQFFSGRNARIPYLNVRSQSEQATSTDAEWA